ncbi:MAG TPA: hypothetical protein VEC39_06290 [Vicinamibacterales bacterium]|nr:hypothetical protein [Vicinamibacterales bacterium]
MSPILTRPVREQLEHDRVIRQLQARYKRKNDVVINPGNEQNQSITVGELVVYPDLLLFAEGGRRLVGTVEVETGESVNPIEARAEWGVFTKLRVPLHLYVPTACVDAARRICDEYQIVVAELWTYATNFDQVRFTLVHRSPDAPMARVTIAKPVTKPAPKPEAVDPVVARPAAVKPKAAAAKQAKAVKGAKSAKTAKTARPVAKVKPKAKSKPAPKKAAPKAKARTAGRAKGGKRR